MSLRRALIVTMAGTSTRFRATAGRDVLKSLYHEGGIEESLLHFYAELAHRFDFALVCFVGGYQFAALEEALQSPALRELTAGREFCCVINREFATRGSGYSLHVGLREVFTRARVDEIVFMEGDLAFDLDTFGLAVAGPADVLTASPEPITARKSVVVYQNLRGEMKFIYDPAHRALVIPEPFQAVYNSGQVWKFTDLDRLAGVHSALTEAERAGSNLVLVEKYFSPNPRPVVLVFRDWVNCNTLEDYHRARALMERTATNAHAD